MTADATPDVVSGVATEDGVTKGPDAETSDSFTPASGLTSPHPTSPGSESKQDKTATSPDSEGLTIVPSAEAFLKNEKAFDVITSDENEGNEKNNKENEETGQSREDQIDGGSANVKDPGVEDTSADRQENSGSVPFEKPEGVDEADPEMVVNSDATRENVDGEPDNSVAPILQAKEGAESEPNMSVVPYSASSSELEFPEEKKAEQDSESASDSAPLGEPDTESEPISAPATKPFAVSSSLDPEYTPKPDDPPDSELRPNSELSVADMEQNTEEHKETKTSEDVSNTAANDSSKSLPESDIKPEANHEPDQADLTSASGSEPGNTDQFQTNEDSKETAEPEASSASGNAINGNEGADHGIDERPEQEPASERGDAQGAEATPESEPKFPTETSADENVESRPEQELSEANSDSAEPAATQDTLAPTTDRQPRSPTRKKPPPRKKPVMTEERPRIPLNRAQVLLMEAKKKEEEEHRILEEERQRSLSRVRKEAEPESGTQNIGAMRQRQQSSQQVDYASDKSKKLPMNKIKVGTVAGPNIRDARSKVGSLANSDYKPGGGNIKIETIKVDLSKAGPRIQAKSDHKPGGGSKKILLQKLEWRSQSKVGSLNNAKHRPGGGNIQVETQRLSFREKAASKIGSKDNLHHKPGGGDIKVVSRRIEFGNATSKVGSMENVQYKPGGGTIRIFEDTAYIRQMRSISAEGRTRRRSPASKSASSASGSGANHTPGRVTPNGRSPSRGRGSPLRSPRSPAAKTKSPPHNGRSPNAVRVSPLPGAKSPGASRRSLSGKTPIPPIGQPSPPRTQDSSARQEGDGDSAPGETQQVPADQGTTADDTNPEAPR